MSTNFSGDPLSNDEIARYAIELRRSQGLNDLDIPNLMAILECDTLLTRFGTKRLERVVVPDEELGGDEAHTLITESCVRLRFSRTTNNRIEQLDRRARFTAAHELGHGVLHRNSAPLARARQQNVRRMVDSFVSVERQANFFASIYLVTDAMAACVECADDLSRYLLSGEAADVRWERESKRRSRPKIAAAFRSLADELRNVGRPPSTSKLEPLVCPKCFAKTLVFVGDRYECQGPCMGVNGEFPDGDGPIF
ncbi:uncharacterized protein DUF955 [Methylovirgula ligni]|uniref:Uncharacterized protein DUF955 n=1 Tax=Methylovirgula ligni TaxID=569860 RepID=A0A3D9YWJ2_9HYPH|nr:ImmA/IrrE family metallo-endopeptidase [Methylovirgula ligni]REF85933.1 uncharacterized protein DUF955 [Methylovirgula ligni]